MASGGAKKGEEEPNFPDEENSSTDDLDLEDDEPYVMYKDRSEWADVQPIPQDDGPEPVVLIDYSPKFRDVYDYLRGVMKKKEYSSRALTLTSDAIMLNAANYTVWQYRRDILSAMGIENYDPGVNDELMKSESEFSYQMIEENQKNYQVWHHRKILVSWLTKIDENGEPQCTDSIRKFAAEQELFLTRSSLNKDAKNYHAWQHRQWVLKTFKTYDGEMQYVTGLIIDDLRNNSAWNHRHFVLSNNSPGLTLVVLNSEAIFTWIQIRLAISNESPWSFLKGLLQLYKRFEIENANAYFAAEEKALNNTIEIIEEGKKSSEMHSFFVDLITERFDEGRGSSELLCHCLKSCDTLMEIDLVRTKYWAHVKRKFSTEHGCKGDNY